MIGSDRNDCALPVSSVLRIAHERILLSAFDNVLAPLEGLHMKLFSLREKRENIEQRSNSRQIRCFRGRGDGGVDHC